VTAGERLLLATVREIAAGFGCETIGCRCVGGENVYCDTGAARVALDEYGRVGRIAQPLPLIEFEG
jgi:hypothetical protein